MGGAGAAWRVAATYMGTVVGAGFASGQETLRFFAAYGPAGLRGLALATALLAVFGALIMEAGHTLGARSHREVLGRICGPRLGGVADAALTAFLFAALAVMIAGGGAVTAEQWGLGRGPGAVLTAALTLVTVLAGLGGLMAANAVVVPILAAAVLGISGAALWRRGPGPLTWPASADLAAAPHWALAACLYAGYNLLLALPVLAPLGAAVAGRRVRVAGAVAGALGLGVLALGLCLAVGVHLPAAGGWEVPVLHLARRHPLPFRWLYALALWAEIYTTAVAGAFGIARRLAPAAGGYRAAAAGAVALALAASGFGFGRLVGSLYPVFGYAALIFLAALVWAGRRRGP